MKKFLSTTELAELLGVSRVTVYNRIKRGEIEAEMVGGNYIIPYKKLGGVLDKGITKERREEIRKIVAESVDEHGELFKILSKSKDAR
ncbi:MAG: helix-turn-helix domain-containing protein [Nanoarchaeota archaeon]|nr:helix-turn-helix domain-containing protein [Nanoarchaeota archaeon]